jgi:phosphate starvation-inducible protein PhoH
MCSNELSNGRTTTLLPMPASKEEFYEQVQEELKQKVRLRGLTDGQQELLETINSSIITLCTGPAGSGKTYIPVVRAVELLREQNTTFKRIIISRPAVECGHTMGYLPGDENEKIEPYMKPIHDILVEQLGSERELKDYMANGIIELCALAYMRGRTINNAIMILDEAQNAEWNEILMFMTRIAKNENPPYVDGINVVRLCEKDIVRNGIIKKILSKMGTYEEHFHYGNRNR